MAETEIRLDISKENVINPVVFGRVADGGIQKIRVTVTNKGDYLNLNGYTIAFEGETSEYKKIYDAGNIKVIDEKNGMFEYTFPKAAFSSEGNYKLAYFSFSKNFTKVTTCDFDIHVLDVVDLDAEEAKNFISNLETFIEKMNEQYKQVSDKAEKIDGQFDDIQNKIQLLVTSAKEEISEFIDSSKTGFQESLNKVNEKIALIEQQLSELDINKKLANKVEISDFNAHTSNKSNPHLVTATQTGAYTKAEVDNKLTSKADNSAFTAHTTNKNNPHSVTAAQTGAYTKVEIDSLISSLKLSIKNEVFPIGFSIQLTVDQDPFVLFGVGKWERVAQGRTIVGVDENDSDFNSVKTGGVKEQHLSALIGAVNGNTSAIGYQADGAVSGQSYTYAISGSGVPKNSVNHTTRVVQNPSGAQATTIQPYITMYIWERTA